MQSTLVRESCDNSRTRETCCSSSHMEHVCGDAAAQIPAVVQKPIDFCKFDGGQESPQNPEDRKPQAKYEGVLFGAGCHMPLLVYCGKKSYRSHERMTRREARAEARGWGPGSTNRRRFPSASGGEHDGGQPPRMSGEVGGVNICNSWDSLFTLKNLWFL